MLEIWDTIADKMASESEISGLELSYELAPPVTVADLIRATQAALSNLERDFPGFGGGEFGGGGATREFDDDEEDETSVLEELIFPFGRPIEEE